MLFSTCTYCCKAACKHMGPHQCCHIGLHLPLQAVRSSTGNREAYTMGNDYTDRKAKKKNQKRGRQALGREGSAKERKAGKISRKLKGACFKLPEITDADKNWRDGSDGSDGDAAADEIPSDLEEMLERKRSNAEAGSSAAGEAPINCTKKEQEKRKRKDKKPKPSNSLVTDCTKGAMGTAAGSMKMSTAINLLDPVAALQASKAALVKRLAPLTSEDKQLSLAALEAYPASLQSCMLALGHVEPTPVQERVWPGALAGRDVQAVAEPGSGKTLAYVLPGVARIAEWLQQQMDAQPAFTAAGPLMLVLLPTRELALQVAGQCRALRAPTGLRTVCVYGGVPKEPQVELLAKGPQIVVGTPGRVLDLVDDGALTLAAVRYVVLDEADKMLGMGFAPQVMRLQPMLLSAAAAGSQDAKESTKPSGKKAKKLPGTETAAATVGSVAASVTAGGSGRTVKPQVLLLTATMPEEVHAAASAWLHKPLVVQVGHSAASISKTITQVIHVCAEHKKPDKLLKHLAMIKERATGMRQLPSVLVFANRVKTVRFLHGVVTEAGYRAVMLHGERTQYEREAAIKEFRGGKAQILVATDVASRGLDIRALPYVVNYDFPARLETYIHRVGRTGRLAAYGHAYSFFTRNLAKLAQPLSDLLQHHAQPVDPNLLALAEAWRIAEAKLGPDGLAALKDPASTGTEGSDDEQEAIGDDAGCGGGHSGRHSSLADDILGAAEDLMEGLGKGVAGELSALLKAREEKKNKQDKEQERHVKSGVQGQGAGGNGEEGMVPAAAGGKGNGGGGASGGDAEAAARKRPALDVSRSAARPGDMQLVPSAKRSKLQDAGAENCDMQRPAQAAAAPTALAYIPAKVFKGARPGYVFKKDALGLGYYLDKHLTAGKALLAGSAKGNSTAHDEQKGQAVGMTKGASAASQGQAANAKGTAGLAGKGAAAGNVAVKAAAKAAADKLQALRNRPIVAKPKADDLDSDSFGSDSSGSDEGSDGAGDRNVQHAAGKAAAATRHSGVSKAIKASHKRTHVDSDEESDGDGGVTGGGAVSGRAVALSKHKALPGRLRKKLQKERAAGSGS